MLGDCLERMKEIPDGSVDLVLTDPPYGTTACSWDSVIPLKPMWESLNRIIKKNGVIVMTASTPFDKVLGASNIKAYKYEWIYKKTMASNCLNAKNQPLRDHENVLVFYKNKPTYNPQMIEGTPYVKKQYDDEIAKKQKGVYNKKGLKEFYLRINKGKRYPKTVLKYSNANYGSLHPTQKPVALMEYLIKTYTNEGDTVLDFTMGSGTTGVACKSTERNFIGIEKDERYFNIAKARIESHKPQMTLF